jgi:hypothetical protein
MRIVLGLLLLVAACGSSQKTDTKASAPTTPCNTLEACQARCEAKEPGTCLRLATLATRIIDDDDEERLAPYLSVLEAACEGHAPAVCGPLVWMRDCEESDDEDACDAEDDRYLLRACQEGKDWVSCQDIVDITPGGDDELQARALELAPASCADGDTKACLVGMDDDAKPSSLVKAKEVLADRCRAGDAIACDDRETAGADEEETEEWMTKACELNPALCPDDD